MLWMVESWVREIKILQRGTEDLDQRILMCAADLVTGARRLDGDAGDTRQVCDQEFEILLFGKDPASEVLQRTGDVDQGILGVGAFPGVDRVTPPVASLATMVGWHLHLLRMSGFERDKNMRSYPIYAFRMQKCAMSKRVSGRAEPFLRRCRCIGVKERLNPDAPHRSQIVR